jgi:FtsP/CotA-like multicopper oxidase with cupredoxin domain
MLRLLCLASRRSERRDFPFSHLFRYQLAMAGLVVFGVFAAPRLVLAQPNPSIRVKSESQTDPSRDEAPEFSPRSERLARASQEPFFEPEVRRPSPDKSHELVTTLGVKYAHNHIGQDSVHLRSYEGGLVGPTLRVKPGTTLRIRFDNQLPEEMPHGHQGNGHNAPHGFNTTNLHTHGLHVSPAGNSDNPFIEIRPGGSFEYEIRIPDDQPPGTFWYHAHKHGAVAMQLASGMAGALIVEGGLDEIPEIKAADEKLFVFQQIPYDDDGKVESFEDSFGPGAWDNPDRPRFTTINGRVLPVIMMHPGEVQRWRFIHGGIRESILVRLEGHELTEVAADGISFGKGLSRNTVELHPGYRSDVLVKASSEPGTYLLVDDRLPAKLNVAGLDKERKYLARVVIEGEAKDMRLPDEQTLKENHDKHYSQFGPIDDEEVTGFQTAIMSLDLRPLMRHGDVTRVKFLINHRAFDPDSAPRRLMLGAVEEWDIRSDNIPPLRQRSSPPLNNPFGHPFHIHVFPFQVISVQDENGENMPIETVWKDTVFVPEGHTVTVRMRYTRYIGRFVLHCHILDHEDQGMMETIEVVVP